MSAEPASNHAAFIECNTRLLVPPLVPEIKLHLAEESLPIWQKTEDELGEIGLPPPFWAFAWAGGQALARYVFDHSDCVADKRVLDLASGSGLVAIAAEKCGASEVIAAEIDPFSIAAIELNAQVNGVRIETLLADVLDGPPRNVDVVLVGDLFYEKPLAERLLRWLRACAQGGQAVFIGDPGRTYLPADQLAEVARYQVPVTRELEDNEIKLTRVWTFKDAHPLT